MSNIHDCIQRAVAAGELLRGHGRAAQDRYNQLVSRYETVMPRHQAQAAAAADLKEASRRAARSREHAVLAQLQAARRLRAQMEAAPDPAVALRNLVERSDNGATDAEAVRTLTEAYVAQANAMIGEVLERHSLDLLGRPRDKAGFRNLVLEAHGRSTGDAEAKRLAEALEAAQEFLRQSFNAHGGAIAKRKHYGLPHSHDADRLRAAGFDTWASDIERRLDWSQIEDAATGRPFATRPGAVPARAESERFLRDVFDGITTRGWDDRDPSMTTGGRALYNQRAEPRVLAFTPEGWIEYNAAYGGADLFTSMVSGLHGMARDVAMMRVLGPNPRAGLEFASQVAMKRAAVLAASGGRKAVKLEERVKSATKLARAMLGEQDGSNNVAVNAAWARFFSGVRSIVTANALGSAILSSVTDVATISAAARMVGMNPANVLSRSVQLMASGATRATAARMGHVATALADSGAAWSRFMGDTMTAGLPQRLASFTLRASGLTFVTDMHRLAFKMEFGGLLADQAGRSFPEIDPQLRRIFESRGISAADWDHLRAPEGRFRADNGADFITPYHWLEHQTRLPRAEAEGLAMRLSMALHEQMEFAIPSASIEGRARLMMGQAPGTIPGELLRSSVMFKSFALSLTLGQIRRVMALPEGMSRAGYAAGLMVPLLVLGAMAVQIKEVAKGRDPRPMDDPKFWMAAVFQSGGLGIFGDFFASETSRAGGGLAETLAGPVVGFGSDIIGPVARGVSATVGGETFRPGREAANFLRYNWPALSSLWQTRLPFDRLVADNLQRLLDPEAETAWRAQEKRREREFGSSTWWDRGAPAPARAPDLTAAAGEMMQ